MSITPINPGIISEAVAAAAQPPTTPSNPATESTGFGEMLSEGIQSLEGLHDTADKLSIKAATGELTDVHDYMIASNKASLATELTVAVRNKAVDAFNEIMRMQV